MKKLDEMTIGELEEYVNCKKAEACEIKMPFKIGEKYLIRTVTMIYSGKLVRVYPNELVIKTAAWIADTGRWMQACQSGEFNEVEPYPEKAEVIIGRGTILDMVAVNWDLPTEQK